MALQLSKTNSEGNSGNYWKITSTTVDWMNSNCSCMISLFKDAQARTDKKSSMDRLVFVFDSAVFPFVAGDEEDQLAILYSLIKAKEEFTGAQDV